jgi:hypothetical protein
MQTDRDGRLRFFGPVTNAPNRLLGVNRTPCSPELLPASQVVIEPTKQSDGFVFILGFCLEINFPQPPDSGQIRFELVELFHFSCDSPESGCGPGIRGAWPDSLPAVYVSRRLLDNGNLSPHSLTGTIGTAQFCYVADWAVDAASGKLKS